MLNLLIVEDDDVFRATVRVLLLGQGWKVTEAADGRAARELIKASPVFDAVITDIQMPALSGVELLGWIKANKPMPVILMTGFSLIMETKKAHDLGAEEFIPKPFESMELVGLIKRICHNKLGSPAVTAHTNSAKEYCKVSIEEFVSAKALSCDVHVKLGTRYVKIGRRGDAIPADRIKAYREKGLKHLFVVKDDFRSLVAFNLSLAKTVASSKLDFEKKANFMRFTGEVLLEKAFMAGIDNEAFMEAKDFLNTSMDILSEDSEALNLLDSLNGH